MPLFCISYCILGECKTAVRKKMVKDKEEITKFDAVEEQATEMQANPWAKPTERS